MDGGAVPAASRGAWLARAFEPQAERDVVSARVEGRIPAELRGTFYRIGPSTLAVGGDPNRHWFDGDGMVCAFGFGPGSVTFRNRFVETPWFARERIAGRRLFSSFASLAPTLRGHLRRPKNPANTNIVPYEGRLLALYEAGRPFALDPASLATEGEEDFDGTLPRYATFSAHPHLDRRTGALVSVGLGLRFGARPRGSALTSAVFPVAETWEVSREEAHSARLRARRGRSVRLRNPDVIHSVGLTPTRTAILAGPYGLDARRVPELLLRRRALFDCVAWRPRDPLTIYVADRAGAARRGALPAIYEIDTAFVIHVANAYDDGEDLVVDAVLHPSPDLVESIRIPFTDPAGPAGRLVRLRLRAGGVVTTESLADVGMEFPTIRPDLDGAEHRFVYAGRFDDAGTTKPTSILLKVDARAGRIAQHDLGASCLFGEPVFVPRPDARTEDDGWVLSLGYDAADHHSFLAILRADAWDEVARVHLPFHVPAGLHASFAPARTF
jgi:all-trans-8'-apo-beta-carotenal 15,15'-oxygenase